MEFRFNPELDPDVLAKEFKKDGLIQIKDIWPAEIADELVDWLEKKTEWRFVYNDGDKVIQLSDSDIQRMTQRRQMEMINRINQQANKRFTYCYHTFPILETYQEAKDPDNPLHGLLEFLNTPETLDFMRQVSGIPEIIKGDAQATRFRGGQFLTFHDDLPNEEPRRIAFVFNLTRKWNPDWGGYLNIYDDEGNISLGLKPNFNVLNIFQVPRQHSVAMVAPFTEAFRFSITGWFMDK